MGDLSRPEELRFAAWWVALLAVALTACLKIVHHAVALAPASVSDRYLETWGGTWGAAIVLLALLGGFCVFRTSAPWDVVIVWSLFGGPAVGLGYLFGITGQMEPSSPLCDAPANSSCDTAFGLGAILFSVLAAFVISALFIIAYGSRRIVAYHHRERQLSLF